MKKTLLICAFFGTALMAPAQKNKAGSIISPVLKKGQQITISSVTTQAMDMGMQITNNTTMLHKISVLDVGAENYTLSSTLVKITANGSGMGQETTYDSDKEEDRKSEAGQQFSGLLDQSDTVLVSIKSGIGKEKDPRSDDDKANLMQSFMSGGASSAATASSILFVVPVELKEGNKWSDSTSNEGIKSVTNYTVGKTFNDVVTINTAGTVTGTTTMEMQGNNLEMTLDTKVAGTVLVDGKTWLVQKRNNVADMTGTIDIMGQSMPFSSKTTIETIYK